MDRNSNSYTLIYATVMVVVVAIALAFAAFNLKPFQQKNIATEKKQNILKSVGVVVTAEEADAVYTQKVKTELVVNSKGETLNGEDASKINLKFERSKKENTDKKLPIYIVDLGAEGKKYVIPVYGAGLWGPIWGYVALNDDMNTVYGANFDHQGETPGLGAEISKEAFQDQFKGKTIFDGAKFVSITVAKAGEIADAAHKVDGISGGTITSKAVQAMVKTDVALYQAYFKTVK